MNRARFLTILKALHDYLLFFLTVAFVTSCCMTLFVETFTKTLSLDLTGENISLAAKLTFLNVIFISELFTAIDATRRKLFVERPVKRIVNAAKQISNGNFDVKVSAKQLPFSQDGFSEIANCFNDMAESLKKTEIMQNDFISNVSHEFKTPLVVIKNYAGLLKNEPNLSENAKEYANVISDRTEKLSLLVGGILRLDKLENGKNLVHFEKFDLGEQLRESLLAFENVWEEKNIKLSAEIPDGVMLESDRELLGIVWNNLLSNAFKFSKDCGRVEVALRCDDNFAYVSVKDNGCGISAYDGERIFDKFYQCDTSYSSSGNGLGLATVKKIADLLSASIAVESRLGEGSVFEVRLLMCENKFGEGKVSGK